MPPDDTLKSECIALLAEIDAAFADVTRENGVSWSESSAIDDHSLYIGRLEARALNRDTHWNQLVDDPNWDPDMGIGGWTFLDPIGTRYYLPAGMKRAVKTESGGSIEFALTIPGDRSARWRLGKLALLSERQNKCIARFIRYMIAVTRAQGEKQFEMYAEQEESKEGWLHETRCWEAVMESHWKTFLS